jgi:hypothetical protein
MRINVNEVGALKHLATPDDEAVRRFDHDEDLRNLLVGQAKNPDSPFEIADYSLREPLTGDWKAKIRERIKKVDQVCVICGEYTDTATGVSVEVTMFRILNINKLTLLTLLTHLTLLTLFRYLTYVTISNSF